MASNDQFFGGLFDKGKSIYTIYATSKLELANAKNKAAENANVTRELQVQQFRAEKEAEQVAADQAIRAQRNTALAKVASVIGAGIAAMLAGGVVVKVIKAVKR